MNMLEIELLPSSPNRISELCFFTTNYQKEYWVWKF